MSHPGGLDDAGRQASGVRPFLRNPAPAPMPNPADGDDNTTTLRPFVITAGRVDGLDPNIQLETQVTVHPGAAPTRLPPEKRAIVSLCVEPLSVAEISARLHMHLGVTRILVGDLRAAGQLDVHVLASDFPDPETIMRVIRGLRAIS
ncbi:DUF742 domain-containing protein [Actinoplanes sp. NPDC051633]|uniref:DUF742 domain-containing protein n=1 Tax=Actinoplanes sp. NPDC051633 TaxID=3155670 RepID=UPI003437D18C